MDGRMVFAPVTEMTDETMKRSREEMEVMRARFLEEEEGGGDEEEGEDEEDDGEDDTEMETTTT